MLAVHVCAQLSGTATLKLRRARATPSRRRKVSVDMKAPFSTAAVVLFIYRPENRDSYASSTKRQE
jgi:hypothetical protein